MAVIKPVVKIGDMGWHDGDAFKVVEVIESKTMGLLVCCLVYCTWSSKNIRLYRHVFCLEEELEDDGIFVGPDRNGDLPDPKWFEKERTDG